jgi:folate-binding protein YgfZ
MGEGMQPTALYNAQERLDAVFRDVAGWAVPAHFGDATAEYAAARDAVAVADTSSRGRIIAKGNDTLDLLNRLTTNLVDPLPDGAGQTTVITTGKGRVHDWITVLPWGERFLLLTSPERRTEVAEWIDMFTFEEDTTLEEVTESTAMLSILGPNAKSVIEQLFDTLASELPVLGSLTAPWQDAEALVARTDPAGQPGFDVVVPAGSAEALWDAVLALGAAPVGRRALESLRIEARVPRWGAEFTDDNNPLEAGLINQVSWIKGCYTGQEVVARLYNYHRIQRFMVAVELPADAECPPGAVLMADGSSVGRVTSVSPVAHDGVHKALASVRAAHAAVGNTLHIGESGPAVTVTWSPEEAQQGAAA